MEEPDELDVLLKQTKEAKELGERIAATGGMVLYAFTFESLAWADPEEAARMKKVLLEDVSVLEWKVKDLKKLLGEIKTG